MFLSCFFYALCFTLCWYLNVVTMNNKFETENGEVFIYNGTSSHEKGACSCGGNCGYKSGGKSDEPCACGGNCDCK